jgi:cytochrome c-type biogenesis protein CcsB
MVGSLARAQQPQFEVSRTAADSLSLLIYQTHDGRMAPIHTLASDVLRKIHQKATYKDFTPTQVLLGMMADPFRWQNEPFIEVKNEEVQELIGISGKYASYNDFFTENSYKLRNAINAAYEKKPAQRSQLDKDLMKVDERINVSYMVYRGDLLKIFPVPNDPNNLWISPSDNHMHGLESADSLFATSAFKHYVFYLIEGKEDSAQFLLNGIKRYQEKFGTEVMPSDSRINLEISFNELNIFERLYPYYMLAGFFLLIINFIKIFRARAKLKALVWLGKGFIILGFIVHLGGLAMRWYVSGHEPWSNGYESMIYIAWASVLAGLIFSRKSEMTLAVTAILAGIVLFVAHLSWMDPEITNLVPVLKSYWLTIHVATIVASYGFFGLGALLAFVNLITFILKRKNNVYRLNLSIKELTYVIEMTLTFGLILLTIGNFLGGIWANESWGRYWGWDPKETWALASILFYAFVLHMRFIPGLKSIYAFNLAALLAFASILMTYFGVNYYLSGLHSYAAGDPVPIPTFVYYTVVVIAIIGLAAYFNNRRLKTVSTDSEIRK